MPFSKDNIPISWEKTARLLIIKKREIKIPANENVSNCGVSESDTTGKNIPDFIKIVSAKIIANVIGTLTYVVVEIANCFLLINFENKKGAQIHFTKNVSTAIAIKLNEIDWLYTPIKNNIEDTAKDCRI